MLSVRKKGESVESPRTAVANGKLPSAEELEQLRAATEAEAAKEKEAAAAAAGEGGDAAAGEGGGEGGDDAAKGATSIYALGGTSGRAPPRLAYPVEGTSAPKQREARAPKSYGRSFPSRAGATRGRST